VSVPKPHSHRFDEPVPGKPHVYRCTCGEEAKKTPPHPRRRPMGADGSSRR
jgi:hypothetical protein